jgi:hypothetical protein
MRRIAVASLVTALIAPFAGHAQAPAQPPPQDIPSGSTFELQTALTVKPPDAALYFQDAQLVAKSAVDTTYVYCLFEIGNPPATGRKIKPQVFTVKSVEFDEREIGNTHKVASVTIIGLDAKHPADAARMTCLWPKKDSAFGIVTADEIRGALGNYFTLTRAQ